MKDLKQNVSNLEDIVNSQNQSLSNLISEIQQDRKERKNDKQINKETKNEKQRNKETTNEKQRNKETKNEKHRNKQQKMRNNITKK